MIKKQIESAVTSNVGCQFLSLAEKEFRAKNSRARGHLFSMKIYSKRRFQQAS